MPKTTSREIMRQFRNKQRWMRILTQMNTWRRKGKELRLLEKGRNCKGNKMTNSKKTKG